MEKEVRPGRTREVLFEGFTSDEILSLPKDAIERLVLLHEPIVFRAGSALILGQFKLDSDRLTLELAQIDGGGEGVLLSLACLAKRFARLRGLSAVEWIVHAVSCVHPNLKLRRILELRGFEVKTMADGSEAYYLLDPV